MDSITQIVLGAACGEAVLGKKVGNRAMLWGAAGGTIPDLDVLANLFTDEISALAFHRGFMHSLLFAVIAPPFLGWLVHRLYETELYRKKGYKTYVMVGSLVLYLLLATVVNLIPYLLNGSPNVITLLITLGLGFLLTRRLIKNYYQGELADINASWRDWGWLFFWAIFTHPLLDCFTNYGTQIFQPFSDYRVAFNTISIVDPIYTVPFLLSLIVVSRLRWDSVSRRLWNWAGIAWSCGYLLFTVFTKQRINTVFEQSLKAQGITAQRYLTYPTIFNNVLWYGVAEGDTAYYYGLYSVLDAKPEISHFEVIPKGHDLLKAYENEREIKILKWFSQGYYNVFRKADGSLQLNNLCFGVLEEKITSENDYIFRFQIREKDGQLSVQQARERGDMSSETFGRFWTRVKGKS